MVAEKAAEKDASKVEEKVEEKVTVKVEEAEEEVKKDSVEVVKPAEASAEKGKSEEEKSKPKEAAAADTSKSEDAATLILSAEEEAEISAQTSEEAVKEPQSSKKRPQKNVWVSNITRSTKAADLKKLFSDKFKVETARIVTNGKTVFGYICLETQEMAESAVKDLNNSDLDGKKVCVSLTRPDLRRTADSSSRRTRDKKDTRATTNGVAKSGDKAKAKDDKKKDEAKKPANTDKDTQESGTSVSNDDKKKEESQTEELARLRRRDLRLNRLVEDLKTDVKRLNTELQNNRRRLTSSQRRLDVEREQKTSIRREIHALQDQMKSDKRKYAQEIEILEKKRKLDEIRYQEDRAVLSRELDECRKLREYLQRKIDDVAMVRHQRVSPPRRSSGSDKMARGRHSDGRPNARSPPPPPKINTNRRSRERSPYKGGKKPRVDDHHSSYGNNHYTPNPSSYSGGAKPLMGYPQSGSSQRMTSSFSGAAYPEPHRFGSSGYPASGGFMGGSSNSGSLLGRPMGYPNSSSGPRKY